MVNDCHIFAMKLATKEELAQIAAYALTINRVLKRLFAALGHKTR